MIKGMILLWSGSVATIPWGWQLCDGTNNTPDLRDRFIVGAGNGLNPDATGGAINHNHDFTGDGHYHFVQAGSTVGAGANYDYAVDTRSAVGTTDNQDGRPPYYALCYIMKI